MLVGLQLGAQFLFTCPSENLVLYGHFSTSMEKNVIVAFLFKSNLAV